MFINLFCIFLVAWGVLDILTGLRTLSYIPLILLGKAFGRPRQIGYTQKELDALTKRYRKGPPPIPPDAAKVDEHGIPYL